MTDNVTVLRVPFFCAFSLLITLLAALSLPAGSALAQGDVTEVLDSPPPMQDGRFAAVTEPQFRLMDRITFPGELIRNAAWLDDNHYLCLTAGPEGACVWTVTYNSGERSMYISPPFFNEHIARFPECLNLSWSLSPSHRYMFLHWRDSAGQFQWRLLDISDPPFFVSKSFEPPGGMHVHDVLFSDDDRYAVFSNDAYSEGSEISLLVLDLLNGAEAWRVSTHDLSFLKRIWWSGETGAQHCLASAELQNGEFRSRPGLAILDVANQTLSYDNERSGLLMADNAEWGSVGCHIASRDQEAPYYIRADTWHLGSNLQVPLSDAPLDIACLSEPGLILVRNTDNYTVSQLWLINLQTGDKHLVSRDCEHFQVSDDDRLLVVPRGSNELHVMQLFMPDITGAQ